MLKRIAYFFTLLSFAIVLGGAPVMMNHAAASVEAGTGMSVDSCIAESGECDGNMSTTACSVHCSAGCVTVASMVNTAVEIPDFGAEPLCLSPVLALVGSGPPTEPFPPKHSALR